MTNEELVEMAQDGSTNARELLVHKNIGIVIRIAQKYTARGYDLEDLVNEGVIGLLEAIDRFDKTRGALFATAAFYSVRGAILFAAHGGSRAQRKAFYRIPPADREAFAAGEELTAERLAKRAGVMVETAEAALAAYRIPASLDQAIPWGGTVELRDLHEVIADEAESPEDAAIRVQEDAARSEALGAALAALDPRLREILGRLYLAEEPETLAEIGETFGVSRERIRQLAARGLERLRESMVATLGGPAPPPPPVRRKPGRKPRPIESRRERLTRAKLTRDEARAIREKRRAAAIREWLAEQRRRA